MPTTSRALLTEIIDYAGLFPPAKLPMVEAFTRFLSHLSSDQGWLLARFVCPASLLTELAPLIEAADLVQTPVRIAALGTGGDDPPAFAEALENDLRAMTDFAGRLQGTALVDVFEVKLPTPGDHSATVDFVCDQLADTLTRPPLLFFEVSLLGDWKGHLVAAADAVSAATHELELTRRAGLKIRCGGLNATAVPTVEAVAAAVTLGHEAGLPMKATQGLHHPIRHHDSTLDTMVHGFFNLFAATVLARALFLDEPDVGAIIAEENPEAFSLTESALRWRDLETGFEEVVNGRVSAMTSFGSCSFTEPRDDLADLGWL